MGAINVENFRIILHISVTLGYRLANIAWS